ncbi:hypothetical protein ACFVVA_37090 [Kitasatospora sp. NPDC058048]|uniref:hypothetical protein n=1 Tax=Kitasatospora sp. NPDC058048 TaxID=3346313 RepID=UPI0036DAFD77
MPYVPPLYGAAYGTLTPDDSAAVMATLAAAGIDTTALVCVVSPSGNAHFIRTDAPWSEGNAVTDAGLLDRMAEALVAAGWEVLGHGGRRLGFLDVLHRPIPAVGARVTVPAHVLPGSDPCDGEVTACGDGTVTVALDDGTEQEVPVDALVPRLWSVDRVAEHLEIRPDSARGQMSRWGVRARTYQRGPTGRPSALYESTEVRTATANRPGRGARTDLRK